MPTVLDWNPTVDPVEVVPSLREALLAGSPVVLPGDCGYVVVSNPASPSTTDQLDHLSTALHTPPAILTWGPDDPGALGFTLPYSLRRLLSRGWPAPLVLAFTAMPDWPSNWSEPLRKRIRADGTVRFRCPEHPMFEELVPVLEVPALVVDTFLPTVEAVFDLLEDPAAVAVSVGVLPSDDRPTVITCTGDRWEITEPGLLSEDEIEKLTARIILFVCTGNTCRSPLAESLTKKILADRLGCAAAELPRRGFWIVSAGVAASGGDPASYESVLIAEEHGADLRDHQSRPLNPRLLAAADEVVAMTRAHAQAIAARYPGFGPEPQLLCGEEDLEDPIGAGLEVYRSCAGRIRTHLERFIQEWLGT
jgi:protein-tyrosine phosphatase